MICESENKILGIQSASKILFAKGWKLQSRDFDIGVVTNYINRKTAFNKTATSTVLLN